MGSILVRIAAEKVNCLNANDWPESGIRDYRLRKTLQGFHAKDDCPEVRKLVYAALDKMDFAVQVVVGRKYEQTFRQVHKNSHHKFYADLVSRLFTNQLHLAQENTITFARRGNKAKQHALRAAVEAGVEKFRVKYASATVTKSLSKPVSRFKNLFCKLPTMFYGLCKGHLSGRKCDISSICGRR